MARPPSLSLESYKQKIVLLLLPIVGVGALRAVTWLRHPPQAGNSTEQVTRQDATEQKAAITQMKRHLTAATEAVNTDNYQEAKMEFNEFHDTWSSVERGFKDKSEDNYEQMEQGLEQVRGNLLKASTPNKDKTLAGLRTLNRTLDTYTNSVFK